MANEAIADNGKTSSSKPKGGFGPNGFFDLGHKISMETREDAWLYIPENPLPACLSSGLGWLCQ